MSGSAAAPGARASKARRRRARAHFMAQSIGRKHWAAGRRGQGGGGHGAVGAAAAAAPARLAGSRQCSTAQHGAARSFPGRRPAIAPRMKQGRRFRQPAHSPGQRTEHSPRMKQDRKLVETLREKPAERVGRGWTSLGISQPRPPHDLRSARAKVGQGRRRRWQRRRLSAGLPASAAGRAAALSAPQAGHGAMPPLPTQTSQQRCQQRTRSGRR